MTPTLFAFERLAALIHQLTHERAARHGLLPVHLQGLSYLAPANGCHDLSLAVADYLGISRGTVSQTLTVLQGKGPLIRTPDERHGKRIHLKLGAFAEAVLQASRPRLDAALAAVSSAAQALGNGLHCAHFPGEGGSDRCGLTAEQAVEICREWISPDARTSAASGLAGRH